MVLFGKVRFSRRRFGRLSLLVIRRFGKSYFLPLPKIKLCVKVGRVGAGSGFQSARLAQSLPTKHAPDVWESARFTSSFLASGFFYISSIIHARPHAGNANR